ncbi:DUF732 domain-containing protein [Mycolicibacterium austroafricanum]|uniref:DUF732 domain-containing protein n=1 Tax=Mycolicibacterium austroafricanum TaxID=39687 RepID=A0ABT8HMN8_MYCAO|nr:DUF732 domain-containing protein [Mycolicibacterium austroafricanum]MDN4521567.1 DUF732 domain-containing protein [Mycolicibacterium austroafricanum]QRZ09394.1 DUF732 domain-containing protein [Mycolicibacterium austroafricanum]QZT70512.1 DUF732 domain-containing protein [Mycolicibacterium austroafricanum]
MVKMLITVLAGAGVALGTAGEATADDYMFLDEVRQKVGAPISAEQAFRLGHVACDAIRDGVNSGLSLGSARAKADEAVGRAQQDMGLSLLMPDGMFLVEAAEHQLC